MNEPRPTDRRGITLDPPELQISDRVRLRPIFEADAEAMHGAQSDSEATRLTGSHELHSLEAVRAHCRSVGARDDRVDYAIEVAGRVVGESVLLDIDWDNGTAWFRTAVWRAPDRGRGTGTLATRALVRFAFEWLGLHRVDLEVYAFNPGARRVYEKVGFEVWGVRPGALLWEGERVDGVQMGVTADALARASANR